MMRIATVLAAVGAVAFAGCSGSQGYVEVMLTSQMTIAGIDHFDVSLTNAGATTPVHVAVPTMPYTLVGSFSFVLAFDGRSGPLEVDCNAVDATGATLASAHTLTHIDEGGTVMVTLAFDSFPDMAMPDLNLSDMAMPDEAMPDEAMPDLAMPDVAMPDLAMPDLAMPDLAMPDLAKPDLAKPDLAMPDLAKPDLATPDLAMPDLMPPCLPTLSNIGFGDFTISFTVSTPAGFGTKIALANQRDKCLPWMGWEARLNASGTVGIELDQNGIVDPQYSTSAHVNDGATHTITIARSSASAGRIYVDGKQDGVLGNAAVDWGTLPPVAIGTSPCDGVDGTSPAPNTVSVGNLCMQSTACGNDLSNVGTGDFTIAFVIQSSASATNEVEIMQQRNICGAFNGFDLRISAAGYLDLEVDSTVTGSILDTHKVATSGILNDGSPHQVVIRRVSQVLSATVDGATVLSNLPSSATFDSLSALSVGTSVCTATATMASTNVGSICLINH